jgi:hypothetical protein
MPAKPGNTTGKSAICAGNRDFPATRMAKIHHLGKNTQKTNNPIRGKLAKNPTNPRIASFSA